MADVFLYSSLRLREARGNLEDDLADFLGSAGEIVGGGGGEAGWNIDIEIVDEHLPEYIEKLKEFLSTWGVPPDTYFDVWDVQGGMKQNARYDVFNTAEVIDWIKATLTFLAERLETNPSGWQTVTQEIQAKLVQLGMRTS